MNAPNQSQRQPEDAAGVTRRGLLRLGLLAAGAGAVAIPAGTLGGYGLASAHSLGRTLDPAQAAGDRALTTAAARPSHSLSPLPSGDLTTAPDTGLHRFPVAQPSPTLHPTPQQAPERVTWLSTWDQPVSRLDEFIARTKGATFSRNAIMLTIDDGPHPDWTPKYLRLLAKYNVRATFCMIGAQVHANADIVAAVVSEGHHIGNHTFHHPLALPKLSAAKIRAEIEDTTDAIVRASGYQPRQFRAPGGNWGPAVFAECQRQGLLPLGWDIDPRDWSRPGVEHIKSAMLAARPHDIILCHDGGGDRSQTFAALSTVIPALLSRGWSFVTLPAQK